MQSDGDTVDDAMRMRVSGTTERVVISINQPVAHLIPRRRSDPRDGRGLIRGSHDEDGLAGHVI